MSVRFDQPADHPHVAVVTIDRAEKANSLDPKTLAQLAAAWRRIADDDQIRCAVVTGAGERVFCAGMDMTTTIPQAQRLARGERVDDDTFEGLRSVATALLADIDLRTPLICAINGHARAGGFDLMLASEIRFAVPKAHLRSGRGRLRSLPDRQLDGHAASSDRLGSRSRALAECKADRCSTRRPDRIDQSYRRTGRTHGHRTAHGRRDRG